MTLVRSLAYEGSYSAPVPWLLLPLAGHKNHGFLITVFGIGYSPPHVFLNPPHAQFSLSSLLRKVVPDKFLTIVSLEKKSQTTGWSATYSGSRQQSNISVE